MSAPRRTHHYDKADLKAAFQQAGLGRGDIVLSYTNLGLLGIPAGGNSRRNADQTLLEAFVETIGPEGTLCVPTYSYSFPRGEPFDPDQTPSAVPGWPEFVRRQPGARRTRDPMFSVAALGARAEELTRDVPFDSFAPGCFWQRFLEAGGWVVNVNLWAIAGLAHYVERREGMPYRYDKLFIGDFILDGRRVRRGSIFTVQDATNPETKVEVTRFDALAFHTGLAVKIPVGRGFITAMRAPDMDRLLTETLREQPEFLIQAGLHGRRPVLVAPRRGPGVALEPDAGMRTVIERLWRLPRDIVSDGYDDALEALATQVPMTIHAYPSGTRAWTWVVPEKWTCHEAWLETMAGQRLLDREAEPLQVMSYSLPFEGTVSREELRRHFHVHPCLPEATPFIFKYYDRDWGLCGPQTLRDSLPEGPYRVRIRSEFSYGELKVGEVVVPGESDLCFVLCAHLCHPAQVADDLSGVAAGLEVVRSLLRGPKPRYTYRFLVLPETIGSVCWLSHHEHLVPRMIGGLFLEMLSLPNPHALQLSYQGDTAVDRCCASVLARFDPAGWTGAFRDVVGNDERQFNAPGVRVPMLSLSRIQRQKHQGIFPYPQYHSNHDNPDQVCWPNLEASVQLVQAMIAAIEAAPAISPPPASVREPLHHPRIPVNLFKGEIFCSRYGLNVDFLQDSTAHRALFDVLFQIDGRHTIEEIASLAGTSVEAVEAMVEELRRHELVTLPPA